MSNKMKIKYDETYTTKHPRDYYRGKSFHFSGKWVPGAHYISDDYNIDFVVHGPVLLACAKSHLSTVDNEPTQFIYDENGDFSGVVSVYWDFVLGGIKGKTPGIKIVDNYWYICENTSLPEERQVWVNTGVKAKMELSDLIPEEVQNVLSSKNELDNATARSLSLCEMLRINGSPTILIGDTAPSTIPAFVGQFYINTSGPALYYSVGNSSISDWKQT